MPTEIGRSTSDYRKPMTTELGNSKTIFGTADLNDALGSQYTDSEIKQWLEESNTPLGDDIAAKFNLPNQLWSRYN